MSVWGDDLDGRDYNTKRAYGMSVTAPPEDYRWHHHQINANQGADSTVTPLSQETKANHRADRMAWLDQFDLEIREEGEWRYWRWLGDDSDLRGAYNDNSGCPRKVMWSERRPIGARLPKIPGFWPADE